ncbi:MAG: radical SAM protein [Nitrosopumilales archaeon]|nr:MAG: radical SAM protein [Nitrosopumilales archaeon]
MKVRYEYQGIHIYDRVTGTNILFDEIEVPSQKIHLGPRVISIALTNKCDSSCYFCYAPKTPETLKPEYVYELCQAMDDLGVLEVAFGGGEPTLYPYLCKLCDDVWNSTKLGISITTNGHHLTKKMIDDLNGNVSIIRFSIDAIGPIYSKIRKYNLSNVVENIQYLQDKISFGINTVINSQTIDYLDAILNFAIEHNAKSLLLLPEVKNGSFVLDKALWLKLENWINCNWRKIPLETTSFARSYLNCPFLFDKDTDPRLSYWHIGANGKIRETSYREEGTIIIDGRHLKNFFKEMYLMT